MKSFFLSVIKFCVVFCIILMCIGCTNKQKLYYSETDNYIVASGVVSYINYNEDKSVLYIAFDDLSYNFSDNCFKITGDNVKIVIDNNIDAYLSIGTTVVFSSAPEYFGDGYIMPIVSVSIDGIEFLSFSEGYVNLMKTYD